MAPKKAKKTADSINSRLALVMKSGKGKLNQDSTIRRLVDGAGSYPGLQVHSQITPIRQSKTRDYRRQHSTASQE
jgi:large subunit ribosomal protein L30e